MKSTITNIGMVIEVHGMVDIRDIDITHRLLEVYALLSFMDS